jgi:hypothetical protein
LKIDPEINFRLQGAIYRWYGEGPNVNGEAEHLAAIGGIQVKARARRLVRVDLDADRAAAKRGVLLASGRLDPPIANVSVILEITAAPKQRHRVVSLHTDAQGQFDYDSRKDKRDVKPGEYRLQAFVQRDAVAGSARSELVAVTIRNG